MCGIVAIIGTSDRGKQLHDVLQSLYHRGPDTEGTWISPQGQCILGHRRLSIIDLSDAARQPMADSSKQYQIIYNGEIYNYLELRKELSMEYNFQTKSDTEVLLTAYRKWGAECLDKMIGMFACVIWDEKTQSFFAARDRFGVKPLYYSFLPTGELVITSEIKAMHLLGLPQEPDEITWSTYLTYGLYDHSDRTFWKGINSLPPGHAMQWQNGKLKIWKWYDLAEKAGDSFDTSSEKEVMEEYQALLEESIKLRFRSDVPVGINLSGGLDSCTLLGIVHAVQGDDSDVSAFTYITGDSRYDELPWVNQMLEHTCHPHLTCLLRPDDVPKMATKIYKYQDEPFGGFPTLAYAKVFERAREQGTIVLLDGQGLDEQWAGYDYYADALNEASSPPEPAIGPVQASKSKSVHPECLTPEFRSLAEEFIPPSPFSDALRNLQFRDTCYTKIPRAVRFSDRISMMHSTELREPFLDHRLFELAFRQPPERKIRNGNHKWLVREITREVLPSAIIDAKKRPLQTPQREWMREDLKDWVEPCIQDALARFGSIWLDSDSVMKEWESYKQGNSDNSFYVFQWVSLGLLCQIYDV